jgi:ABC-type Mn2+/Zn2+ transport system permease subunit
MDITLILLLVTGGFIGAASGYIGSFMVLKRMSLVGDALSHVALPGMAIALAFHFSPILGAMIALTIAVVGVWYFEQTSNIYPEALVGLFFTGSLALGILITPEPELLEALFGNIENITLFEAFCVICISCALLLVTKKIAKKIVLEIISKDLMQSIGISSKKIRFIYLLLVGCIVAIGVKFIGSLLMGALVIIPAVSAKNISSGMNQYFTLSILLGICSTVIGALLAHFLLLPTGPIVVLVSIFLFVLSYISKQILKLS